MQQPSHEQLLHNIADLRRLVASCSTEAVIGSCAVYWFKRSALSIRDKHLSSPAKQWSFLLGLMLSTPEPSDPQPFDDSRHLRACQLLEKIFCAYILSYFPAPGEAVTDEWRRARGVAMPAFLKYFNEGLLATTDQVQQRIKSYLCPFDDYLHKELGLSASQAVEVCRWITNKQQSSIERLAAVAQREKRARVDLLGRMEDEGWDLERLRAEAQNPAYRDLALELCSGIPRLPCIFLAELTAEFGTELATAFWRRFSISRGELTPLQYPTDYNMAEEKPLYRIDDGRAMCPLAHQLFLSLLVNYERFLASGAHRETFFRKRDVLLEKEAEGVFRRLLGSEGTFFTSVYETPDSNYEHDLVIRIGRALLVVEAKASPFDEPWRDPERAFRRIANAFKSDKGIQHAYDQTRRLWERWTRRERIALFSKHGEVACELDAAEIDEMFIVCVTRDNFGMLAVNLSLLLEKGPEEPYPWCVNVLDAEAIADAWDYFGWNSTKFLDFLRQRMTLHGRLLSSDELEVVGFFINHGGLHWLAERGGEDFVALHASDSDVFDRIYAARKGGPPVRYEPSQPVLFDMRETVRQGGRAKIAIATSTTCKKQQRNAPCACGSGKKYKRCCGR